MLTQEQAVEIRVLKRQGLGIRAIAKELGGVAADGAAVFARSSCAAIWAAGAQTDQARAIHLVCAFAG